jgi:hypothetical protein
MASVVISGDTSGTATLQAQGIAGNTTLTLPTTSGTLITTASGQTLTSPTITGAVVSSMASSVLTVGTAQATTSGTSKSFLSIPSWVKRITVIGSGVNTNGSSPVLVQLGSGSIQTTGYNSSFGYLTAGSVTSGGSTSGFGLWRGGATDILYFNMIITNISGNTWVQSHSGAFLTPGNYCISGGGNVTISAGVVDRLALVTTSTDNFNAGSVNIIYE